MKFTQIIEFQTSRIDDFNANLDAWMTRTEGSASRTARCWQGPRCRGSSTC